jgi:hypothetical protein
MKKIASNRDVVIVKRTGRFAAYSRWRRFVVVEHERMMPHSGSPWRVPIGSYGAASQLSANVHSCAGYSARSTGSTVAQFSGVNASIGRKSAEPSS